MASNGMLPPGMVRWLSALIVGGVVSSASVAYAQSFALDWDAPASCPDALAVRAETARLLAQSRAASASVQASGQVTRQGARWALKLSLEVDGRHAERTLTAADCAALGDTAAWLVAVAVDPELPAPAPSSNEQASTDEVAKEPDAEKAESAKDESATSAQADERETASDPSAQLTWHLGLFGGAFAGGLAGANPSAGVRASLEHGGWSAELSLAHHFKVGMDLPEPPEGESEFSAQELGLAGCYAWGQQLRFGPCAVLSGLLVHGGVEHVAQGEDADALWSTVGGSLALNYRELDPWELFLDGGLWLSLSKRPRFEVDELGPVGQGAGWGGRVRVGVGVRLP